MIVFFSGSSVILGAIVFILLILSAAMSAGKALQDVLLDYGFEMILILSVLAIIYWAIITYGTAEDNGYPKKKYITISSLLFGISSGISLYNCICLICTAIMTFIGGFFEDELLFIFTSIVWLIKAFFYLILCVPVVGLGIGIPFYIDENNKYEKDAYIWGSVALISQIVILIVIFLV